MAELTGIKHDGEKPRMDLLPTVPMVEIAKVLTFGAKKYAAHNWRGGIEYSRLIGSAYRHLSAFNDGEDYDPESGLPHLAHLGCCVFFLLEQFVKGTGLDDRYKTDKMTVADLEERYYASQSTTIITPAEVIDDE
jgi:hypothetical protein